MTRLTPLPDQEEDAALMAAGADLPNFSLAGTGKTITALRAIELAGVQRGLILAPRIAQSMWAKTIKDFLGADVHVIKKGGQAVPSADFIVCTYDLAWKTPDLFGTFTKGGNDVRAMVNDESHKLKSADANRTKFIVGPRTDLVGGLAERFDQVWNMSGTPIRAFADDLWTQVGVYHRPVFAKVGAGSLPQFRRMFTFSQLRQYNKFAPPVMKVVKNINEVRLHDLLYKEIGCVRRTEIEGLPKLALRSLEYDIKIPRDLKTYSQAMSFAQLGKAVASKRDDDALSKFQRMVGLLKIPGLLEHVVDSAEVSPVLLGVWHRDVGAEYEQHLTKAGLVVQQVNGSTPSGKLDDIQDRFNNGDIDVLVGQMAAMGESWNLQSVCKHVIIAENYPVPSVLEQFYKRVYRRGQTRKVQVDIAVANTPLDEMLYRLSVQKDTSNSIVHGDTVRALTPD